MPLFESLFWKTKSPTLPSENEISILPLCNEVLLEIIRFLLFVDVDSCRKVSRQFYNVIRGNRKLMAKMERSISVGTQNNYNRTSLRAERWLYIALGTASIHNPHNFRIYFCPEKVQFESIENDMCSVFLEHHFRSHERYSERGLCLTHQTHFCKYLPRRFRSQCKYIHCEIPTNNCLMELKELLLFMLPRINVNAWNMENSLNVAEWQCIAECISETNKFRSKGVPLVTSELSAEYWNLAQLLRSPKIIIGRGNHDILSVDTSYEIIYFSGSIDICRIEEINKLMPLMVGWTTGQRSIKKFTIPNIAENSKGQTEAWMEQLKRLGYARLIHVSLTKVEFHLPRVFDSTLLKIGYYWPDNSHEQRNNGEFRMQEIADPKF